jgi:16S rRNA (uracil1498-N3)-methyltransferase
VAHPRFYSSQPLPRPPAGDVVFEANEEIARHLQVLRMGANDAVTLFDGLGGEWAAVILVTGKRSASLRLLAFDPVERESTLKITLVQALATGDKMDLIVQKAVELGIGAIQPIASERATLKLAGDRAQKRTAHWQAIAQAACEQCGRNRVPVVAEVVTLETWLAMPADDARLMLHPQAELSLIDSVDAARPIALMVGPEGGFSEREISLAATSGVTPARFGPRVLRAETAGLAAIAAINAVHGDLQ